VSRTPTDDLIRDLARGLLPVRRVPRLRRVLGTAMLAAAAGGALFLSARGVRSDLVTQLAGDAWFRALAMALLLGAIGAPLAATAASVPGRRGVGAFGLACVGIGAIVAGVTALEIAAHGMPRPPAPGDVTCLLRALVLAVAPGLVLLFFAARAAPRSALAVGALAAAAAAAFGALAVHVSCPSPDPAHWGWGHGAAPVLAVLAAAPAFAVILARRRPSSS